MLRVSTRVTKLMPSYGGGIEEIGIDREGIILFYERETAEYNCDRENSHICCYVLSPDVW